MKKISYALMFLVFTLTSFSQELSKGSQFFSIGIGSGINYGSYSGYGIAFRLAMDKGFKKLGPGIVSVGGQIGVRSYSYSGYYYKNYYYSGSRTTLIPAVRLGYFYNMGDFGIEELNFYGGISAGLRMDFYNLNNDIHDADPYNNGLKIGIHVGTYLGANFFLTKNIAFFGEVGYDIGYGAIGVVFKL